MTDSKSIISSTQEFNWPHNCSYCSSRTVTKHCLLPFEVVLRYDNQSTDAVTLIDIIELHSQYGLDNIINNFNLLLWFQQKRNYEKFSTASEPKPIDFPPSQTENSNYRSLQITKQILSQTPNSGPTSHIDNQQLPKSPRIERWADQIQSPDPQDQYPLNGVPLQSSTTKTTTESTDDNSSIYPSLPPAAKPHLDKQPLSELPISTTKPKPPKKDLTPSTLLTKALASSSNTKPITPQQLEQPSRSLTGTSLTQNEILHISEDVARSIITAHNLATNSKFNHQSTTITETLSKELYIKRKSGTKYIPTYDSPLNHPIALAKELISYHSNTMMTQWESCSPTSTHKLCFLDQPDYSAAYSSTETISLYSSLLKYAKSTLDNPTLSEQTNQNIRENTLSVLESRDFPYGLNWLKLQTQTKVIKRHEPPTMVYNSKRPESLKEKKQTLLDQLQKHVCPPTSPELERLLQTQFNSIVESEFKTKWTDFTETGNSDRIRTRLELYSREIMIHDSNWTNPKFSVNISKIHWIASFSNNEFQSADLLLVRSLITSIIRKSAQSII